MLAFLAKHFLSQFSNSCAFKSLIVYDMVSLIMDPRVALYFKLKFLMQIGL